MRGLDVPGYTEVRVLGSGGFGDVVLARHDQTGTLVAVKYLRPALLADPGFANMFREEARVLASLDTPHAVRFYEYVESSSGAAVVMEFVAGVSLRAIFSDQGRLSAEAALVVLEGSLLGLAAAHARGVVHRDYRPENVLVNRAGISKISDFGIAARASDRPIPAGTLAYAPPEQLGGGPASPAGDVYAATVTFYECVVGQPPFTGDTPLVLLGRHQSEPVPMDQVPELLRPLVAAGMAKVPWDRPANAASFVTELREVAGAAYGQDWEDRGRSSLREAAFRLAALSPTGATPAARKQVGHVEHLHQDRVKHAETGSGTAAAGTGAGPAAGAARPAAKPPGTRPQRLVRAAGRSKHLPRWVQTSLPRDPSPGGAAGVVAGAAAAVLVVVAVIAVLAATLISSSAPPRAGAGAPSPSTSTSAPAATATATAPAVLTSINASYTMIPHVKLCSPRDQCVSGPLPLRIACNPGGSCTASSSHWAASHRLSFNGTTLSFTGNDEGVARACNGHSRPATIRMSLTVVSWKTGPGTARTPEKLSGPYDVVAPPANGCPAWHLESVITS